MGKATVESVQRLDAHFWAREPIRRAAPDLVRRLAAAQVQWQAGEVPKQTGLIGMHWTRGGTIPAGDIQWGILREEGGQAQRLLLVFSITSSGQSYPRRQEVRLDWNTPGGTPARQGKPARQPVLLCPFCGRRCRYLCATYPGRKGGPYLGEFACRLCANLCYAKQLEYKSAWLKNFDAVFSLFAKSQKHPERVTEADFAKMEAIAQRPLSLGSRLDKLLARAELRDSERNSEQDSDTEDPASGLEKPEKPRLWDVLPPPVFTSPKRLGRPSAKRQRQQARACARIVRQAEKEAEQAAKPKQPVGRPKERREYNASGRIAGGCAGQLAPEEGYCVGCRGGRRLVDAIPFTANNGRVGVKGKCAECGRGLCRMGRSVF